MYSGLSSLSSKASHRQIWSRSRGIGCNNGRVTKPQTPSISVNMKTAMAWIVLSDPVVWWGLWWTILSRKLLNLLNTTQHKSHLPQRGIFETPSGQCQHTIHIKWYTIMHGTDLCCTNGSLTDACNHVQESEMTRPRQDYTTPIWPYSDRDIFCLKNFDTSTRTSVRVWKMNAVVAHS